MAIEIKDVSSLKKELQKIIDESLKSALYTQALREKENQTNLTPNNAQQNGSQQQSPQQGQNAGQQQQQQQPSKTMSATTDDLDGKEPTVKDVIEKLNVIRAGKSFKDDQIMGNMQQWYESLSSAEKVALFAFLQGISELVSGNVPGQDATEPSDPPTNIEMNAPQDRKQSKTVKPNLIKTGPGPVKPAQKTAPAEDTTPPTTSPITPKRR